tara:strand:+ start:576 stop:1343 length:768 start_codon:yes stop_codon:yes gene_type:complete
MTNIIAFAGVKQSGKTTCSNFVHGLQLVRNDAIENFGINDKNELIVFKDSESGVLDLTRTDDEFLDYVVGNVWPFVKLYNFADSLKYTCMNLFGLTKEQCFGSDKEKNKKIGLLWENMPDNVEVKFDDEYYDLVPEKKGKMTAREFMQHFGTDICRKMRLDVWTSECLNRIKEEQTEMAVIGDCRFPNEVEAIQKSGGKVIRLTRSVHVDTHDSETSLDKEKYDWDNFDAVVDNSNCTIKETNEKIQNLLDKWRW